jgi:hypothetical protein
MRKYQQLGIALIWALVLTPVWSEDDSGSAGAPVPASVDPFTYHRSTREHGSVVPALGIAVPDGIEVLAVIEVRDRPSYTVLRIPGRRDSVTAKSGDIIRVENARAPRPGGAIAGETQVVYLLVGDISLTGVEISPVERPSEIHVFQ